MKLWLLRPKDCEDGDNPWEPWYDKAFGLVVRAETEAEARQFAHVNAGDENRGKFGSTKIANTITPWLDPKYSSCEPLEQEGESGVVIRDYAAA